MSPSLGDSVHDSSVVCVPDSARYHSSCCWCRLLGSCLLGKQEHRTQRAYPFPHPLPKLEFRPSHRLLACLDIPSDGNDQHPLKGPPSDAWEMMQESQYPLHQDDFGIASPGANCLVRAFAQYQEEIPVDDHRSFFFFDPVYQDLLRCPSHQLQLFKHHRTNWRV